MELLVVLALEQAPNMDAWQRALDRKAVPIRFSHDVDFAKHKGFVPASIDGRAAGFYFRMESYAELSSLYPAMSGVSFGSVVYTMGYGANAFECATAYYAAAALVSEFEGRAFEPQAGVFMREEELTEAARVCAGAAQQPAPRR